MAAGTAIEHPEQLEQAAAILCDLGGATAVLLKGGHLSERTAGTQVTDLSALLLRAGQWQCKPTLQPRIASQNTHGTVAPDPAMACPFGFLRARVCRMRWRRHVPDRASDSQWSTGANGTWRWAPIMALHRVLWLCWMNKWAPDCD